MDDPKPIHHQLHYLRAAEQRPSQAEQHPAPAKLSPGYTRGTERRKLRRTARMDDGGIIQARRAPRGAILTGAPHPGTGAQRATCRVQEWNRLPARRPPNHALIRSFITAAAALVRSRAAEYPCGNWELRREVWHGAHGSVPFYPGAFRIVRRRNF